MKSDRTSKACHARTHNEHRLLSRGVRSLNDREARAFEARRINSLVFREPRLIQTAPRIQCLLHPSNLNNAQFWASVRSRYFSRFLFHQTWELAKPQRQKEESSWPHGSGLTFKVVKIGISPGNDSILWSHEPASPGFVNFCHVVDSTTGVSAHIHAHRPYHQRLFGVSSGYPTGNLPGSHRNQVEQHNRSMLCVTRPIYPAPIYGMVQFVFFIHQNQNILYSFYTCSFDQFSDIFLIGMLSTEWTVPIFDAENPQFFLPRRIIEMIQFPAIQVNVEGVPGSRCGVPCFLGSTKRNFQSLSFQGKIVQEFFYFEYHIFIIWFFDWKWKPESIVPNLPNRFKIDYALKDMILNKLILNMKFYLSFTVPILLWRKWILSSNNAYS